VAEAEGPWLEGRLNKSSRPYFKNKPSVDVRAFNSSYMGAGDGMMSSEASSGKISGRPYLKKKKKLPAKGLRALFKLYSLCPASVRP
jgi:hypothetical protein